MTRVPPGFLPLRCRYGLREVANELLKDRQVAPARTSHVHEVIADAELVDWQPDFWGWSARWTGPVDLVPRLPAGPTLDLGHGTEFHRGGDIGTRQMHLQYPLRVHELEHALVGRAQVGEPGIVPRVVKFLLLDL